MAGGQPGGQGGQPGGQGGQGGQGGKPGGQGGQPVKGGEEDDMTRYGTPFVLRVKDPLKLLKSEPTGRLGSGGDALDIPLKDDGKPPDVKKGDQIYSGVVDLYPATSDLMLLVSGDKELLSFNFDVSKDQRDPAVEVTLKEGGGTVARLIGKGDNVEAVVETTEMRSPNQAAAMPGAGGSTSGASQIGGSLTLLSIGVFLAGGLLGGSVAWLRLRAGPAGRLAPVGPGPSRTGDAGEPSGRGRAQVWISPRADDGLAAAAARWASTWGPVLLVPDPAHRARLAGLGHSNPHLYWLPEEQPEPSEVMAALSALRGEPAVVVDGLAALVPAGPTETSTAPTEELCANNNIIVVLGPDEPIPPGVAAFRFREEGAGFQLDGGGLYVQG